LLAGVFWDRRACPPTVRAVTAILGRRDELGPGDRLASGDRPGTSCRTGETRLNRLYEPAPGQRNKANEGDDDENIHTIILFAFLVFVTWPSAWRAGPQAPFQTRSCFVVQPEMPFT